MVEAAAETAEAHRIRSEIHDEVMKLGRRRQRFDIVPARPTGFFAIAHELAVTPAEQALGGRREGVGHADSDMIDRLQQNGIGLGQPFGDGRADLNPATDTALRALAHAAPADASFTVAAFAPSIPDDPSTPRRLSLSRALTVRSVLIAEGIEDVA